MIDAFALSFINVEFSNAHLLNATSLNLHLNALTILKQIYPTLKISITVTTSVVSGLDDDGLAVLDAIVHSGLLLDILNLNALNFAAVSAPNAQTSMGTYAISTAEGVLKDLDNKGLTSTKLGLTVMIGQNDFAREVFSVPDAKQVAGWAHSTPRLLFLSYFSANSDVTAQYAPEFAAWSGTDSYHLPVVDAPIPAVVIAKAVAVNAITKTGQCGLGYGNCPGTHCCSRYVTFFHTIT